MTVNPYTPPSATTESTEVVGSDSRLLKRASTLYRWIGWLGVIYFCVQYPVGIWLEIRESSLRVSTTIGMTLMTVFFLCLFATMIRLASRLQTELETVYRQARWSGILVGACGFPLFTLPAFYAVWLVGRERSRQNSSRGTLDTEEAGP